MDHAFQFNSVDSEGRSSPPPPPPSGEKVKTEMDFFAISSSKTTLNHHHHLHHDPTGLSLIGDDHNNTSDNNDVNTGLNLLMMNTSTAVADDAVSSNPEEKKPKTEVVVLRAEVERLNGENQRLRNMLSQATGDYNSLQMQLIAVMEERNRENNHHPDAADHNININNNNNISDERLLPVVPRQFMDLGLGDNNYDNVQDNSRSSSDGRSIGRSGSNNDLEAASKGVVVEDNRNNKELRKRSSSRLRDQHISPDQELAIWNSKLPRFSSPPKNNVDQAATEATMRKARVSVRARSEANMITDGCQWRKYGQKMAKGNPCPRAYYRCTMTGNCPVRKQVQRCAEDKTILITTYEGNHNHPLPPAAMAMASTTSSAARMLLSGSMSSTDSLMNANFLARTLLPCSSNMATISASAPFPTVTLDLTQNPNSNSLLQTPPPSQLQIPFQSFPNPSAALLPQIFRQALFSQSKFSGLQTSLDSKGASSENQTQTGENLTAVAADPNFTAALAAAISSIIGGGSQPNNSTNSSPTTNGNNKINNSSNQ